MTDSSRPGEREVFARCQSIIPSWRDLEADDFTFEAPKGFSSFTVTIRARAAGVEPPAIFYRHLDGKENAILDFEQEREVFLLLGDADIAARCHHYDHDCRVESCYEGRTLRADELLDVATLKKIADALWRFHQLTPTLPEDDFFTRLHHRWEPLARRTIVDHRGDFPENEQAMCADLEALLEPSTLARVRACVPEGRRIFCHNDTYHGNIMRLEDDSIRLLDFEFSCLNHPAYDFSNLFAETVMQHKQPEYPYFRIGEPPFTDAHLDALIRAYLANDATLDEAAREAERATLLEATRRMLPLSHYMYAMAALPLALNPIQKIRFVPYAHARFRAFLAATE